MSKTSPEQQEESDKISCAEQAQDLQRQTFASRARYCTFTGGFFLDNRFGKLLVKSGFVRDPVEEQREHYQERALQLAERFQKAGAASSPEEAARLVEAEPDFLAKSPQHVMLEAAVDRTLQWKMGMQHHGEYSHNLAEYFEADEQLTQNVTNISTLTEAKVLITMIPEVLGEKLYVSIRDLVLSSIAQEDWAQLYDFLTYNYTNQKIRSYLVSVLSPIRNKLFQSRSFRHYTVSQMLKLMVDKSPEEYASFDQYLAHLGLDISDPREKAELLDVDYFYRMMNMQWGRDRAKYFAIIERLYAQDLLPPGFGQDNLTKKRFLEFALLALYNQEPLPVLTRKVRPLFELFKLGSGAELSLGNQHNLYGQYRMLCYETNAEINPQIRSIYHRPKSFDRYEE